jgi:hypothetical protein
VADRAEPAQQGREREAPAAPTIWRVEPAEPESRAPPIRVAAAAAAAAAVAATSLGPPRGLEAQAARVAVVPQADWDRQ